jgi:putative membrane protein
MKTKSLALRCALLVSAVSLCTALSAETTAPTNAATTPSGTMDRRADMPKLSHSDHAFFEKAAKSGMKEVTVSQTAMANLMNPQVKSFAQMMVTDHSSGNTELMALAASKGVMLPASDKADTKLEQKWSKKVKNADEEYMEEMVSDHKETVELFEKASKSQDSEVAAFAQKMLPTLQHHLSMAQDLKKTVHQ